MRCSPTARHGGYCGEVQRAGNLWTSRVTSHVPLKEVSSLLSAEKVAEAIAMITGALRASGKAAVAGGGVRPESAQRRQRQIGDEGGRVIEPG